MNEFDPQDKERLENWKALQVALGLAPEETPVPVQPVVASPLPNPPPVVPPPRAAAEFAEKPKTDVAPEIRRQTSGEEPLVALESASTAGPESADAEREVEVGEAPEEIPEETSEELAAQGDNHRRRRRRRRRRGGGDGADESAVKSDGPLENAGLPSPSATDADDEAQDDGEEDEDEEEIEPLSIPDWNVPTWQELIASLYRPER